MPKLEQKKQETLADLSFKRPESEKQTLPEAKLPEHREAEKQQQRIERRQQREQRSQKSAAERRESQEEQLRRVHEKDSAAVASSPAAARATANRGYQQHIFNRDALLAITKSYQDRANKRAELHRMVGVIEGLSDAVLLKLTQALGASSKTAGGLATNTQGLGAELKDLLVALKGAGVSPSLLVSQGSPEHDLLNEILALYIPPDKIDDANDEIRKMIDENGEILY